MNFIYKVKRFFRNIEIENLMTYIAISMAVIFVGDMATDYQISEFLSFNRELILQGQVWRIITFLLLPQTSSPFWIFFSVMFYYFTGKELEQRWGSHNLTMYFLTGAALLIGVGFATGYAYNSYLYFSFFLCYAFLYPHEEFRIYFVIPLEARWLALIDIVFMLYSFISSFTYYFMGDSFILYALGTQLSILAAFGTFAIFFGKPYVKRFLHRRRHKDFIHEMKRNKIRVRRNEKNDDE